MKKINAARLFAWVMVLAIPLWLGSCKNDGNNVTPSSSIEGSWKISGFKINPAVDLLQTGQSTTDLFVAYKQLPIGNDIVDCLTSSVITFNSGGKISGTTGSKCSATTNANPIDDNSTWKLDGTKLTITSGTEATTYDTVISGNSLKLTFLAAEDYDGDGKNETYTRTLELTKA
ncbi:lipocalin family protein [Spirosoma sp. KNUC1025]|uniref:lipocalin family protein n=1 Tax=Spirosoma sp. KNUC1025 TaxID=2894082 RepID=UPI00386BAA02|nr:lipocalin family protein [Spirosoma sp. KNUC1025]